RFASSSLRVTSASDLGLSEFIRILTIRISEDEVHPAAVACPKRKKEGECRVTAFAFLADLRSTFCLLYPLLIVPSR
ncbi:MAG TPA: hypothetical protein VH370_22260, partial [Humisphaera sp.]|nr:hypothetical protein [Humisphaera sp.]